MLQYPFRTLTGMLPYERSSDVDTMWAHVHESPPSLLDAQPDLPAALAPILEGALAKRPDDRPARLRARRRPPSRGANRSPALDTDLLGAVEVPERLQRRVARTEAKPRRPLGTDVRGEGAELVGAERLAGRPDTPPAVWRRPVAPQERASPLRSGQSDDPADALR